MGYTILMRQDVIKYNFPKNQFFKMHGCKKYL